MTYPRILPVGDAAFTVELGDKVDRDLNLQVHALDAHLQMTPFPALLETVPSYRSLLVIYEPQVQGATEVRDVLTAAVSSMTIQEHAASTGSLLEVPMRYGGTWGPDLETVAQHCGLLPEEVVERHSRAEYLVAMLGFAPGFAYLLGMPPELATPRLNTPRLAVPAGSIGIADTQTGIYGLSTPGGWRLIGRTEMTLFDPHRPEPFTLRAGDRVRFVIA